MSSIPRALAAGAGRQFSVGLPLFLIALFVLIAMGNYLAGERYAPVIASGLLLAQLFLVLRHWRLAVYVLFVYVILEGFIINYFGARGELNLIKDGLVITVFVALLFRLVVLRQPLFAAAPWKVPLAGYALLYTFQVFNPALPSITVGLIGLRVTLLFVACALVGYWFFFRREIARDFLRVQMVVSIPVSIFGIMQYFLGPAWLLSISPGFERTIFYAGGRTAREVTFRTISTFASTGGFSSYLWFTIILTFAFYRLTRNPAMRVLALGSLALQGVAMLTTGGRGSVVWLGLTFLVMALLMRRLRNLTMVGALAFVVFFLAVQVLGGSILGRYGTILDYDLVVTRNAPLLLQISAAMQTPPEGLGAGRTSSAGYRYAPNMEIISVENHFAKARYEAGLAGLLLFTLTFAVMGGHVITTFLRLKDPELRWLGAVATSIVLTIMLTFPLGNGLDIPPINFYFWFLLGMVYALLRIQHVEQDAQAAAAKRAPDRQAALLPLQAR